MGETPGESIDETLRRQLAEFMGCFETLFDNEWDLTRTIISDDQPGHFIAKGGTFLNPGVGDQEGDESSNWHNRGNLLAAYRNLAETMTVAGIRWRWWEELE